VTGIQLFVARSSSCRRRGRWRVMPGRLWRDRPALTSISEPAFTGIPQRVAALA
jgi:hypothetical protein